MKTTFQTTILSLSFAVLTLASCSNDNENTPIAEKASNGAIKQLSVGGANQPNQVFLDLSTETSTPVNRVSWDF